MIFIYIITKMSEEVDLEDNGETEPSEIEFQIKNKGIKYKLNIKNENENITFSIIDEEKLPFIKYIIIKNFKVIKSLNKSFSKFYSVGEFFKYLKSLYDSNNLNIEKYNNKITILLFSNQDIIQIDLFPPKNGIDINIKEICKELLIMKEKVKEIDILKNEIVDIKRNSEEETKSLKEEIKKLKNANLNDEQLLNKFLEKSIKDILEENNDDIINSFNKVLKKFVNKNISKDKLKGSNYYDIDIDNYEEKLILLFNNEEKTFMKDILEKAKSFIKGTGKDIFEKLYIDKYNNKNNKDIINNIKEYIFEKIFENILMNVISALEENNFLTTLLALSIKKEIILSENVINEIKNNQLKNLIIDDKKDYNPKFNLYFIIPGFYLFYEKLSDFITDKIVGDYIQNENRLRYLKWTNKELELFHKKEKALLNLLYQEMKNYDWKFDLIKQEKIKLNLIVNDYIIFYLIKNEWNNEGLNDNELIK